MSTTKDREFSSSKHQTFDKKNTCFNGNQNDQYKSVNLNQNRKCENLEILQSKSKLTDGEKKGYAFSETKDFVGNFCASKNSSNLLKKSEISLEKLNLDNFENAVGSEKYKWKNHKTGNNNKSTLSLHITAYENSIEATSGNDANDGTDNFVVGKNDKIKKSWKNVKSVFLDSTTEKIQNPFELPRQQNENHVNDPEVMQFKASHRMILDQRKDYRMTAERLDRLLDVVEELSAIYEQNEIDIDQFKQRLKDHSRELGFNTNSGSYNSWCSNVCKVRKYFDENNFGFKNSVYERIAQLQRKFEPNFCLPPPPSASSSNANATNEDRIVEIEAAAQQNPVREEDIDTTQAGFEEGFEENEDEDDEDEYDREHPRRSTRLRKVRTPYSADASPKRRRISAPRKKLRIEMPPLRRLIDSSENTFVPVLEQSSAAAVTNQSGIGGFREPLRFTPLNFHPQANEMPPTPNVVESVNTLMVQAAAHNSGSSRSSAELNIHATQLPPITQHISSNPGQQQNCGIIMHQVAQEQQPPPINAQIQAALPPPLLQQQPQQPPGAQIQTEIQQQPPAAATAAATTAADQNPLSTGPAQHFTNMFNFQFFGNEHSEAVRSLLDSLRPPHNN